MVDLIMIQLWLVSTLDDVVKKDIIYVAAVFRPPLFVGDEKRRVDIPVHPFLRVR